MATGSAPQIRDIQKIITALNSPIRREILSLVWDRPVPAGQIASVFSVTKPTISQHLAVLKDAGLVETTAAGTSRLYRARHDALRGLHAALHHPRRWESADEVSERHLAEARTTPMVVARVEVGTDQETTFRAFTDPVIYSRWLGVPVTLVDGRFSCTMEWGTQIRGRYDVVAAPELVAMRWDFDDDNVPVPGEELVGYLRIQSRRRGSEVVVHQLVESAEQARFMEAAWTTVLGRLKAGVVDAVGADGSRPVVRARRPKRRRPDTR